MKSGCLFVSFHDRPMNKAVLNYFFWYVKVCKSACNYDNLFYIQFIMKKDFRKVNFINF